MKRHLVALAALLAVFACALCSGATPLPPPPTTGWCSDGSNSTGYFGVRACPSQPPPPTDGGAYTSLIVNWMGVGSGSTDATSFNNLWGRTGPHQPASGWPGGNGATLQWTDTGTRYIRARLVMPLNPGTRAHMLKPVSYGETEGIRARIAVVPAGAPWPTSPSVCAKLNVGFTDQPAIWLSPISNAQCRVYPGIAYDILIDTDPPTARGTMVWSWN